MRATVLALWGVTWMACATPRPPSVSRGGVQCKPGCYSEVCFQACATDDDCDPGRICRGFKPGRRADDSAILAGVPFHTCFVGAR